jgi:hypothetical protein
MLLSFRFKKFLVLFRKALGFWILKTYLKYRGIEMIDKNPFREPFCLTNSKKMSLWRIMTLIPVAITKINWAELEIWAHFVLHIILLFFEILIWNHNNWNSYCVFRRHSMTAPNLSRYSLCPALSGTYTGAITDS